MTKRTAVYVVLTTASFLLGRATVAAQERPDEVADLVLMLTLVTPLFVAHALVARETLRGGGLGPLTGVWRGVLAGAIAGVGLGIGLRLGMRAVALGAGQPTTLTVGGTALVVGIGVFYGGSLGSLFAALRKRSPSHASAPLFGVVAGSFFWFAFYDAATGDLEGIVTDFTIGVLTTLLSLMWVAHGAATARLLERFDPAGSARRAEE